MFEEQGLLHSLFYDPKLAQSQIDQAQPSAANLIFEIYTKYTNTQPVTDHDVQRYLNFKDQVITKGNNADFFEVFALATIYWYVLMNTKTVTNLPPAAITYTTGLLLSKAIKLAPEELEDKELNETLRQVITNFLCNMILQTSSFERDNNVNMNSTSYLDQALTKANGLLADSTNAQTVKEVNTTLKQIQNTFTDFQLQLLGLKPPASPVRNSL